VLQNVVALVVAEVIVDILEPVEVDHDQRERTLVSLHAADLTLDLLHQVSPIVQSG